MHGWWLAAINLIQATLSTEIDVLLFISLSLSLFQSFAPELFKEFQIIKLIDEFK